MSSGASKFRVALCQLHATKDKAANLQAAQAAIEEAVKEGGAQVVALPEIFNSPYSNEAFGPYSEPVPGGESYEMLSGVAKDLGIYLVGGSIPEKDEQGQLYNTALVFDPEGELLAMHRKLHLFDIDVPGKITFRESDTLTAGDAVTTFDTAYGRMGLGICYDMRFPELAQICGQDGARVLFYPGCFNMTTGPAHWELLQRARALDNQVYVCTISQARDDDAGYVAWGHSSVCDPWGSVISTTEHEPAIVYADVDLDYQDQVRSQIPVLKQKRTDVYALASVLNDGDDGAQEKV